MLRIKELRVKNNITLQKLATHLHTGTSTISQYESGKREANFDTLCKIADYFHVSVDYLLGREGENDKYPESPKALQKGVKIPVLGIIPAGIPIEAIEDILDYEEISEDMAQRGEYFALKVKGDSMSPTVHDGDIVIVRKQDDAESGKICVVMINGYDATLKEIKKETTGLWVLPHNPSCDFKPTFFSNQQVIDTPVRIIGVAVEIRRSL